MRSLIEKWMNGCAWGPEGVGGGEAASPSGGGGGGSGGGTPAPSSAPDGGSGAAQPGGATPTPSAAPDYSALGSTEDLDYQQEIPAEPPPPPTETPQPAVAPQPAVQPAQAPAASPPTQTPPPTAGEARPYTASDPWRIAEGLEANRDAIVAHLAQAKFALSEEDIKDLDTDVTVAVPKLLARVFLESQVSMQKFLAQAVPGMMGRYNAVSTANNEAERKFFAAHRALDINNPQHRAAAVRIATVYRQANPDIPLDRLIAEVGPMVMTALQVNAAAHPQGTPHARSAGAFVPAVNGGGGHSPAAQPESEWAGLGRDYD